MPSSEEFDVEPRKGHKKSKRISSEDSMMVSPKKIKQEVMSPESESRSKKKKKNVEVIDVEETTPKKKKKKVKVEQIEVTTSETEDNVIQIKTEKKKKKRKHAEQEEDQVSSPEKTPKKKKVKVSECNMETPKDTPIDDLDECLNNLFTQVENELKEKQSGSNELSNGESEATNSVDKKSTDRRKSTPFNIFINAKFTTSEFIDSTEDRPTKRIHSETFNIKVHPKEEIIPSDNDSFILKMSEDEAGIPAKNDKSTLTKSPTKMKSNKGKSSVKKENTTPTKRKSLNITKDVKSLQSPFTVKNIKNIIRRESDRFECLLKSTDSLDSSAFDLDESLFEDISGEVIEKLRNVFIVLPFTVPHQHMITNLSPLTMAQKKELQDLGITMHFGPFSKEEDAQLMDNWKRFYKSHDFTSDPTPFLRFQHQRKRALKAPERMKFLHYLAHNLPFRTLRSVHQRFQRICSKELHKSGRFSETEDKCILGYLMETNSEKPYEELSKKLHRTNKAIMLRAMRLMERNDAFVRWEQELIDKLVKYLLRYSGVSEVSELEDATITAPVWAKCAQKMKIPVEKLTRAWRATIYPRLFIMGDVCLNELKVDILETLIQRKVDDYRTIPWVEIAQEFPGMTSSSLNKVFRDFVRMHVPDNTTRKSLKDSLNYLKENLETLIIKRNTIKKVTLSN